MFFYVFSWSFVLSVLSTQTGKKKKTAKKDCETAKPNFSCQRTLKTAKTRDLAGKLQNWQLCQ